ncbi:MAG: hypothetical protein KAT15_21310, partial [Bacteroidales bacterium]|nr:hypothetical protein [Bacteroidales bacterium]
MHSPRHILTAVAIVLFFQVSGQTYISGELTSHTTWTEAASPYVITDSLIVGSSAILTLEAGTKIMFKYHPDPVKKSFMVVHGGIRSNGNFENFVVFTSDRDDSVMDLHGDGQATLPRPGDWEYVRFNNTNPGEGEHGLDWTLFRYGGGRNPDSLSLPEYYPMVTFRDEIHNDYNTMWVNDCQFEYSKGVGIRMGNAVINNTYINNCAHGILLTSSTCGLTNSVIQGNAGYPILFNGLKMTLDYADSETENFFIEEFSGNSYSNNGQNYFAMGGDVVVMEGDEIPGPMTMDLFWKKLPIPYLVTSPLKFYGLNIYMYKGTLVKFKYYPEHSRKPFFYLDSGSSLFANMVGGDEPIVFTSEYDHRYDYEPFTGSHRDPMAGDWGYIEGSDFDLRDCVFKYGGLYADPSTGEAVPDSSAVLRARAGVSGSTRLTGCLFNNLYRNGIMVLFESSVDHPMNIISTSFLLAKNHYGIKTVEPEGVNEWSIEATDNYWYGKLGPFHPDSNAIGNGCKIDDNITFRPFMGASDDELELVSSVVRGIVRNLDGEVIPNALVKL